MRRDVQHLQFATGNRVDSDTEQLADELRRLREHLVARGINSGEDAIEVGTVAEAEKAATKKDPSAVATALKKLAAGTLELVGTLGLLRLKIWLSEKLGIDSPVALATRQRMTRRHGHKKNR